MGERLKAVRPDLEADRVGVPDEDIPQARRIVRLGEADGVDSHGDFGGKTPEVLRGTPVAADVDPLHEVTGLAVQHVDRDVVDSLVLHADRGRPPCAVLPRTLRLRRRKGGAGGEKGDQGREFGLDEGAPR